MSASYSSCLGISVLFVQFLLFSHCLILFLMLQYLSVWQTVQNKRAFLYGTVQEIINFHERYLLAPGFSTHLLVACRVAIFLVTRQ